jgi:hypothetical protein
MALQCRNSLQYGDEKGEKNVTKHGISVPNTVNLDLGFSIVCRYASAQ